MSSVLSSDINMGGIYRAMILKQVDTNTSRIYIPCLFNDVLDKTKMPVDAQGNINEDIYQKYEKIYPLAKWCVSVDTTAHSQYEGKPCWIVFEGGNLKYPIIVGFFNSFIQTLMTNSENAGNSNGNIGGTVSNFLKFCAEATSVGEGGYQAYSDGRNRVEQGGRDWLSIGYIQWTWSSTAGDSGVKALLKRFQNTVPAEFARIDTSGIAGWIQEDRKYPGTIQTIDLHRANIKSLLSLPESKDIQISFAADEWVLDKHVAPIKKACKLNELVKNPLGVYMQAACIAFLCNVANPWGSLRADVIAFASNPANQDLDKLYKFALTSSMSSSSNGAGGRFSYTTRMEEAYVFIMQQISSGSLTKIMEQVNSSNKIIEIAQRELALGPQRGGAKYWRWAGWTHRDEWCAMFVSYCASEAGLVKSGVFVNSAGVNAHKLHFISRTKFKRSNEYTPNPGDAVFFDWSLTEVHKDNTLARFDHIGLFEKMDANLIYVIEGNSGDELHRRRYSKNDNRLAGYGAIT